MEIAMTSLALSCAFLALFIIWAWKVVNWVWLRPKKLEKCLRQQGFKGNSYRLLYGDLNENNTMLKEAYSKPINLSDDIVPRLLPFNDQLIKQHGKNSFMWLGPIPRVNIMEPELIKEVLTKIGDFQRPVSNPLTKYLASGLASHEGDQWAKHRKIINPAFHIEKLKNMLPAFYQCSSEMVSKWESLMPEEGSCELDVWPYLENLAGEAISRTAFGSSYEEGKRIFQLQREQSILFIQAIQSVYIPGWRFVPTKRNKRMKEIDNEVQASIRGIIDKRVKAMQAGEAAKDDLLGLLMESNFKEIREHGNNEKVGISTKEVIAECKQFYIAGQETTSNLLVWTMIELSKHHEWQERAREEVLQAFGKNKPDFQGLNNLKIMPLIMHEVLRLYPPVVLMSRRILKDTRLGKYMLPAGIQISLPTLQIHHDCDLWGKDAKDFNPKRFTEGVSKATKSQVSYFPFGWGPRICIGMNFAMVEAKMALSMILQRYLFELSPTYAHAPFTILTLQPQHGAQIILHKLCKF